MNAPPNVTELLARHRDGDAAAGQAVFAALYDDLHARAAALMRDEPRSCQLQPTALIGEAWLRVARGAAPRFEDRNHFLRLASRAMRNALIDHARRQRALRRSGRNEPLDAVEVVVDGTARRIDDVLDLHAALERLAATDPQLAEIVELRYFAGLTLAEAGDVLGLTIRQVHRSWLLARAWLERDLRRGPVEP